MKVSYKLVMLSYRGMTVKKTIETEHDFKKACCKLISLMTKTRNNLNLPLISKYNDKVLRCFNDLNYQGR